MLDLIASVRLQYKPSSTSKSCWMNEWRNEWMKERHFMTNAQASTCCASSFGVIYKKVRIQHQQFKKKLKSCWLPRMFGAEVTSHDVTARLPWQARVNRKATSGWRIVIFVLPSKHFCQPASNRPPFTHTHPLAQSRMLLLQNVSLWITKDNLKYACSDISYTAI